MADHDVAAELMAAVPLVTALVRRHTDSDQDAEDCVADALEAALRVGRTARVDNPGALLLTIARRRAVDRLRSQLRGRRMGRSLTARALGVQTDHAEEVCDAAEAAWLWELAATRLPASTVEMLQHMSDGATLYEAADRLGMSRRAAESRLLRSRRLLRALRLGALGGLVTALGRALRRSWTLAPHSVLVGLLVLPLTLPWAPDRPEGVPAPPYVDSPKIRERQETSMPAAPTARERGTGSTGVRTVLERPRRVAAPRSRQVLKLDDPGNTTVTEEDRGGPDDPVFGTLKCLREWQVTPEQIGC